MEFRTPESQRYCSARGKDALPVRMAAALCNHSTSAVSHPKLDGVQRQHAERHLLRRGREHMTKTGREVEEDAHGRQVGQLSRKVEVVD